MISGLSLFTIYSVSCPKEQERIFFPHIQVKISNKIVKNYQSHRLSLHKKDLIVNFDGFYQKPILFFQDQLVQTQDEQLILRLHLITLSWEVFGKLHFPRDMLSRCKDGIYQLLQGIVRFLRCLRNFWMMSKVLQMHLYHQHSKL